MSDNQQLHQPVLRFEGATYQGLYRRTVNPAPADDYARTVRPAEELDRDFRLR